MPMPHDVKTIFDNRFLHMIKARKGGIEFLAGILGKARTVTRDKAVFASPPLAEDINGIIELAGTNFRKEPGFQCPGDEELASSRNCRFLSVVRALTLTHFQSRFGTQTSSGQLTTTRNFMASVPPISRQSQFGDGANRNTHTRNVTSTPFAGCGMKPFVRQPTQVITLSCAARAL